MYSSCVCVRFYVCVYLSVKDIIPEEFRIPTHSSLPPPPSADGLPE